MTFSEGSVAELGGRTGSWGNGHRVTVLHGTLPCVKGNLVAPGSPGNLPSSCQGDDSREEGDAAETPGGSGRCAVSTESCLERAVNPDLAAGNQAGTRSDTQLSFPGAGDSQTHQSPGETTLLNSVGRRRKVSPSAFQTLPATLRQLL